MNTAVPVDLRMYAALQKLKGIIKLTQDAQGKVIAVRDQAKGIADVMREARKPLIDLLPTKRPRSRAHLKVVK